MSSSKLPPITGAGSEPTHQEINTLVDLYNHGRYSEMEAFARKMTVRFPRHGIGWKAIGTALLQQKRYQDALTPLQKAVELSQGDAQPPNNLGNAFVKLGRLSEAEASYRRALELAPGFAEAHFNLGNTLQNQGRYSESEASYRQALALNPNIVGVHENLGLTLGYLGKLDEAIASYQRSLELKHNEASVLFRLHALLLDSMDMVPSIQCLKDAVALQPDNYNYRFFLGLLLEYTGDYAAAAIHLDFVAKGDKLGQAQLDAWEYIKNLSVNNV